LAKINTDNDAVLIDLASIESIDSSGLGAIIAVVNSTRGKTNLLFCGINENIRRVMDLTRCSAVLNLHPSVNDAIEMLQQKSREFKKAA
jgi:anti-sigma B factor antagonist